MGGASCWLAIKNGLEETRWSCESQVVERKTLLEGAVKCVKLTDTFSMRQTEEATSIIKEANITLNVVLCYHNK